MNEEKIIQYLKGELNPQESKDLCDWIQYDEANFESFKQLKQAWALSNAMKESGTVDERDYHIFRLRNLSDDEEETGKTKIISISMDIKGCFRISYDSWCLSINYTDSSEKYIR